MTEADGPRPPPSGDPGLSPPPSAVAAVALLALSAGKSEGSAPVAGVARALGAQAAARLLVSELGSGVTSGVVSGVRSGVTSGFTSGVMLGVTSGVIL